MNPSHASRVLLVEDDAELASMVADYLSGNGFEVTIEVRGDTAVQRIETSAFDALVLDIGLPGVDGITICRTVRNRFSGPILMLTARGDEIDEVVALEVGADDYMTKPVRPRALLARLRMHLRRADERSPAATVSKIEVEELKINAASRTVQLDGHDVSLTTAEFDLLWLLAERAGTVVPRDDIYQQLLGVRYDGIDRSIDLRVSRLRKKIGDDPTHPQRIKSVRGVGYILAAKS